MGQLHDALRTGIGRASSWPCSGECIDHCRGLCHRWACSAITIYVAVSNAFSFPVVGERHAFGVVRFRVRQGTLHWCRPAARRDSDAYHWSARSGCRVPHRKVDCLEWFGQARNILPWAESGRAWVMSAVPTRISLLDQSTTAKTSKLFHFGMARLTTIAALPLLAK